ncbi:elongation factor Ts [Lonsdalea britannica]|nr:elongation factor Ts [Lonsdalea britannica]
MMECKKALVEANGDIELAIDNMRKSGQAKAAKKAGRVAAEGIILTKIAADGKYGVIAELNCETDFVAKDAGFKAFGEEVATAALNDRITDVEELKAKFEDQRTALVAKIGENINIRRISVLSGDALGSYLHGARIGVMVAATGADEELIKHIAMHIAASKPEYVKAEDVPADVVAREHQIQLDIAMQSGKPREIAEKMVEGRMRKFTGEISLSGQHFVMDPSKTVGQLLKEHNADVTSFIRYEVGEGIEKAEVDFAAEVAAMSKQS